MRYWLILLLGFALLTGCDKQEKTEQTILFQPMQLGKNVNVGCFFVEPTGSLWLGLDGEGMAYKESMNSAWRFYNRLSGTLPADVVICSYRDAQGLLWFGSFDKGLFYWDGGRFEEPQWAQGLTYVSGFAEDAAHRLWVATLNDGIACKDSTGHLVMLNETNSALTTNYITDLKTFDHQTIYVASGWGLFALHADSRSIEPVTDSHDKAFLKKQLVRFLYPNTRDGLLWIGTQTGLYIYNKDTRAYRHLTTTDGLADNLVKAIGSDQHGNVWICSDSTLTRLTPTADGNYLCQPYRRSDGIGDGIFHVRAIASMPDGTLLFGTSKGCLTVRNSNGALPVKAHPALTLQTLLLPFLLLLVVCILLLLRTHRTTAAKRRKASPSFATIEPSPVEITPLDEQLKEKAIRVVEEHLGEADFSVEQLSDLLGMSRGHLYKRLTAITGLSPQEFIRTIRLKRGRQLLEQSGESIQQVAWRVGLSPKQFAKYFKEAYGVLPSDFIRQNTANLTNNN